MKFYKPHFLALVRKNLHFRPVTGVSTQWTQNISITFIQCWTNVEDVGPTLSKCYKNVLCTGYADVIESHYSRFRKRFFLIDSVSILLYKSRFENLSYNNIIMMCRQHAKSPSILLWDHGTCKFSDFTRIIIMDMYSILNTLSCLWLNQIWSVY